MVNLYVGDPGSGKTKIMIAEANAAAEKALGEIVFIDVVDKQHNRLDRKVRLIYTSEFSIDSLRSIYGLLCGIISANRDVEKIYLDGLEKMAIDLKTDLDQFLSLVKKFSEENDVDVTIAASIEDPELLSITEKYK